MLGFYQGQIGLECLQAASGLQAEIAICAESTAYTLSIHHKKSPHKGGFLKFTGRLFGQNTLACQQILNCIFYRTNLIAKRQWVFATEEQAFVYLATESRSQFQVNTELTDFVQTIAQAALSQAVDALSTAAWVVFGIGLQGFFTFQIAF